MTKCYVYLSDVSFSRLTDKDRLFQERGAVNGRTHKTVKSLSRFPTGASQIGWDRDDALAVLMPKSSHFGEGHQSN